MSVTVTKHAEKRLRERVGLNKKAIQRAAEMAYDKGIKHCETTGNLNKWVTSLYFNNRTANNIRLYNDKAWIFAGKNLVTVLQIPASLKKSVKETLDRKKEDECLADRKAELRVAKDAFLRNEWVDTEKVQEMTGMTFSECLAVFDFSRTAEWWSIVGKTEEERQRNGQCIITKFRLKEGQRLDPVTMKPVEVEKIELECNETM